MTGSEEGKKLIDEWVSTYKKSRDEFKKEVDQSFSKVEAYFGSEEKKKEE